MTLLELLVVIAILTLLAAMGGSAMESVLASTRRVAATDRLVDWFEQGRVLAIVHGRASYVVLGEPTSAEGGEYRSGGVYLEAEDPADPPVLAAAWGRMPTGTTVVVRVPSSSIASDLIAPMEFAAPGGEVIIGSGGRCVKFAPTGEILDPTALSGVRYALKGKGGVWAEVALSRFSGKVKVLPPS